MRFEQVNYLMDVIMPTLADAAAFSIVSVVARNTWGRSGTEWVELSYKDFKDLTGIQGVNTIKRAIEKAGKFMEQRPKEGQGFEYRMSTISILDIVPAETVSEMDISKTDTVSETDIVLYPKRTPPLSKMDTVSGDTSYKEKEKKGKKESPPPPLPSDNQPLIDMVNALVEVTGMSGHRFWRELSKEAAELLEVGYTPEQIIVHYGRNDPPNGHWNWYVKDWRGMESSGNFPKPKHIWETISGATRWKLNEQSASWMDEVEPEYTQEMEL
jgi:hypothetical protein